MCGKKTEQIYTDKYDPRANKSPCFGTVCAKNKIKATCKLSRLRSFDLAICEGTKGGNVVSQRIEYEYLPNWLGRSKSRMCAHPPVMYTGM